MNKSDFERTLAFCREAGLPRGVDICVARIHRARDLADRSDVQLEDLRIEREADVYAGRTGPINSARLLSLEFELVAVELELRRRDIPFAGSLPSRFRLLAI